MLKKKATIVGGKTDQGLVMVNKETGKGIKFQNEVVFNLTSLVWQLCDQMEPAEIAEKLAEELNLKEKKQKEGLLALIKDSIKTFNEMDWVEKPKKAKKQ